MHDDREALQVLGLALRAGRAAVGTGAVKEAAAEGGLRLVVAARDAGENALGRVAGALRRSGADRVRCGTRAELGAAVGRGPVAVVGVTDRGLAERVRRLLASGDAVGETDGPGEGPSRAGARATGDETKNTIHTS